MSLDTKGTVESPHGAFSVVVELRTQGDFVPVRFNWGNAKSSTTNSLCKDKFSTFTTSAPLLDTQEVTGSSPVPPTKESSLLAQ